MSFNAAALKLMLEKGLTLGDVVEIAAANESRSSAAERQARYRKNKKGRDVTRDVTHPPNEIDNLTPPCEEKPEPKGSVKKFILPSDIPAEPWADWLEMRRRIRKGPTDKAKGMAVAELRRLRDEEGWPPGDVLNHCTLNSYQGIFPPKGKRSEQAGKSAAAYASIVANLAPDETF